MIQKWMDVVPRAFVISDIHSSSARETRGYAIFVRSRMIYGSENRPLLADVVLKFERAKMQMIRWMNKELRRLVGV